jgi:hypothetical protein
MEDYMAVNDGSFGSNFASFLSGMTGEIYKRQVEEQQTKQRDEDAALKLDLDIFSNLLQHPGQFNEQQIRQHVDRAAKNPRISRIVGKDYQNQITPLLQATQEAYRDAIANDLGKISGQDPRTMSVDQIAHWKVKKGELERETAAQAEKNRQWQAGYDLTKLGQDQAQTYRQADLAGNIQGRTDAAERDRLQLKAIEEGKQASAASDLARLKIDEAQLGIQRDNNSLIKSQNQWEREQGPIIELDRQMNKAYLDTSQAALQQGATPEQADQLGRIAAETVKSRFAPLPPKPIIPKPSTGFKGITGTPSTPGVAPEPAKDIFEAVGRGYNSLLNVKEGIRSLGQEQITRGRNFWIPPRIFGERPLSFSEQMKEQFRLKSLISEGNNLIKQNTPPR